MGSCWWRCGIARWLSCRLASCCLIQVVLSSWLARCSASCSRLRLRRGFRLGLRLRLASCQVVLRSWLARCNASCSRLRLTLAFPLALALRLRLGLRFLCVSRTDRAALHLATNQPPALARSCVWWVRDAKCFAIKCWRSGTCWTCRCAFAAATCSQAPPPCSPPWASSDGCVPPSVVSAGCCASPPVASAAAFTSGATPPCIPTPPPCSPP